MATAWAAMTHDPFVPIRASNVDAIGRGAGGGRYRRDGVGRKKLRGGVWGTGSPPWRVSQDTPSRHRSTRLYPTLRQQSQTLIKPGPYRNRAGTTRWCVSSTIARMDDSDNRAGSRMPSAYCVNSMMHTSPSRRHCDAACDTTTKRAAST
jgi:hypothetical protein